MEACDTGGQIVPLSFRARVGNSLPPWGQESRVTPSALPTNIVRLQRVTVSPVEVGTVYTKSYPPILPRAHSAHYRVIFMREVSQWTSPQRTKTGTPACTKSTDHRVLQSITFSNKISLLFFGFWFCFCFLNQAYSCCCSCSFICSFVSFFLVFGNRILLSFSSFCLIFL